MRVTGENGHNLPFRTASNGREQQRKADITNNDRVQVVLT